MTWKLCANGGRQDRKLAGLGQKERFSLQTLPEAAQSVKGPKGQPQSTSQRKQSALPGLRDQMQQDSGG